MLLDEPWQLDSRVALRPEPFGALVYHFGTRKLSFLKTPGLVEVVRHLADSPTVADALKDSGIEQDEWDSYLKALETLASSGMVSRREEAA
jgi:putative mycofactocin binding protein MftB